MGRRHRSGMVVLCRLVVISAQVLCAAAGAGNPPAIFVFGDSMLDVGNNNYLTGPDVPRANKPYYGIDFPGVPTGRFSNGYNVADFIAKNMGFPSSPPAYLSLLGRTATGGGRPLVRSALGAGVSYASGGAGILDSTNAGNSIPLSKQVRYFGATKSRMVAERGAAAVNRLLSRSVFLISIGSNDLFLFAQSAGPGSDVGAFYSGLISNYSATVQKLHRLGARKFALINVGMLGCVPAARLLDANGTCEAGLNTLASGFDDALASAIPSVVAGLTPAAAYSLADLYGLTEATFADPGAVGYTDVAAACCGGGRLGAEQDCLPNSTVCADRDRHAFWDRVHPSQRASMLTAMNFYRSRPGRYTMPIDFKGLAESG